jgi:hypothetical protein
MTINSSQIAAPVSSTRGDVDVDDFNILAISSSSKVKQAHPTRFSARKTADFMVLFLFRRLFRL